MTPHVPAHSTRSGVVSSGWLAADSTFGHAAKRKTGRALAASLVLHGLGLLIILAVMAMVPETVITPQTIAEEYDLVFVQTVAPEGGGGGGGNSMPTPPRIVEMKAALPTPPVIEPVNTPPPPPTLIAPIQTSAVVMPTAGVISGLAAAPSMGLGAGGGGGTGKGTGAGSGDGPGIGPGSGGGVGGGPMGPGSGATPPTLLGGQDPAYTSAAYVVIIQMAFNLR